MRDDGKKQEKSTKIMHTDSGGLGLGVTPRSSYKARFSYISMTHTLALHTTNGFAAQLRAPAAKVTRTYL